jgi:erythromycin esterase-like protein
LRVGNLPEKGTKPEQLINFLNEAMRKANLCYFYESPVRNCLVVYDHNVAYLGFCTARKAREALDLNGIPLLGNHLQIGRPQRCGDQKGSIANTVAGGCSIDLSEAGERAWVAQVQGQLDQTSESLLQAAENFRASNKSHIDDDTQDKLNHRREDLWQTIAKNLQYASYQIGRC